MATANGQREIIEFALGKPEIVELQYRTGREIQGRGGPKVMFTTTDDRIFFVDSAVAGQIEAAAQADGPIAITRYKGPKNAVQWDVERRMEVRRPNQDASAPRETAPAIHNGDSDSHNGNANRQQPVTTPQAKLLAALCVAIDSAIEAEQYAKRRGLPLEFTSEDIRAFANTIMINAERARA